MSWQRTVACETDSLRHVRTWTENSRHLTRCGQRFSDTPVDEHWPACHICLPGEAHPLAAVWRACERFDDRFNAGAGEPKATSELAGNGTMTCENAVPAASLGTTRRLADDLSGGVDDG